MHCRVELERVADHQHPIRPDGLFDDETRFRRRRRQRFLDQHMLAASKRLERKLGMGGRRGRDHHGIDVR